MKDYPMNWYLIQIKPYGHSLAQEHLLRQGFKVFLPLMSKTSRKGVKFINKLEPLFPSYLFMGTELIDIPWKSVNSTRGVLKAITLDGNYRAVAPEIMEAIKSRCDQNGIILSLSDISVGDRVKIEKGPFSDFICRVEKINDRERAWVLIEILQQQILTDVSSKDLSKIN